MQRSNRIRQKYSASNSISSGGRADSLGNAAGSRNNFKISVQAPSGGHAQTSRPMSPLRQKKYGQRPLKKGGNNKANIKPGHQ